MPSASAMLSITQVAPGVWAIRAFVLVDGMLADIDSVHNAYCSVALYDPSASFWTVPETKVDADGKVTFDGTIIGSGNDTTKKAYRIFAYYKKGAIVRSVYTDILLGYAQFVHTGASTLERWLNWYYYNIDAGREWWIGMPDAMYNPPYNWWIGHLDTYFVRNLDSHIGSLEPLWDSLAPAVNLTSLSIESAVSACPVCNTKLGIVGSGKEVKCPICGFVSSYTRKMTTVKIPEVE